MIDAYLGAHHDTDLGDDALLADGIEQLEAEEAAAAAAGPDASDAKKEGSR